MDSFIRNFHNMNSQADIGQSNKTMYQNSERKVTSHNLS